MTLAPRLEPSHEAPNKRPPVVDTADDFVVASLTYLVDTGERPVTYMPAQEGGESRRTGVYTPYPVPIHDGRSLAPELSLDRQGFALTRHDTQVSDFFDDEEVRRVYYPEMARLVKAATGASEVLVFDHNVRVDGESDRHGHGVSAPVRNVHNDYTDKSGPQRMSDLLDPVEAEARLKHRVAVINVWRPIEGPVRQAPLALADAASVAPGDLAPLDLVYPDRTGEIYNATFNPSHRWFYFPNMERHEAILIKGYDSQKDGRARFTLHTAFDDPTSPADAPPRQSIEVRTLVLYDS